MVEGHSASPWGWSQVASIFIPRSWRWILVAFSYYVILHLGTSLLIPDYRAGASMIWSFLIIQSIVSVYLGWKTTDYILSEMVVAGTVYALLVDTLYDISPQIHSTEMAVVRVFSCFILGLLGTIGALLGRLIRERQLKGGKTETPA